MKLLASLLGCAAADYACCPYDDFGVVNPGCPLTEKTPWAMTSSNANPDPMGVANHICKAWEANIDATMEGNEDGDNWGGCGFQRHFPWGITDSKVGDPTPNDPTTLQHCSMGMFDCTGAPGSAMTSAYVALKTGAGFEFPLQSGAFANNGDNHVFGRVTLGGVCKLWIPVRLNAIDSVSIAGVHMNGGGTVVNGNDETVLAVFDGAEICDTADCSANNVAGTAFCFSVVNVAEFMENNMPGDPFRVMNANVAGRDIGGHDPITLDGPEDVGPFSVDFGSSIEPTNPNGGTGTIVDVGASFDVVVHFKSAWCIRHWTIIDMQTDPDVGSNVYDYPLKDDANDNPQHAHTDVADKRFNGQVGICGCCDSTGNTPHDDPGHVGNDPSADSCEPCAGTSCTELNTYGAGVTNMKWPNAGAWAAYHSFITCADENFMIYDVAQGVAGGQVDIQSSHARIVVHSMFYNDVRHDYTNAMMNTGTIAIRGNIRQVGTDVTNCGPGVINTADNKRCTWNWNFGLVDDEEEWFSRTDPQVHAVWKNGVAVSRNDEADAHVNMISDVIEDHSFTFSFQTWDADAGTASGLTHSMAMDASKYFSDPDAGRTIDADEHKFVVTMHCLASSLDGNGGQLNAPPAIGDDNTMNIRDIFPDCYMGDEIHFSYTIAGGASPTNTDHRLSAWFSHVTATTF
jgi:hypothetical protein